MSYKVKRNRTVRDWRIQTEILQLVILQKNGKKREAGDVRIEMLTPIAQILYQELARAIPCDQCGALLP